MFIYLRFLYDSESAKLARQKKKKTFTIFFAAIAEARKTGTKAMLQDEWFDLTFFSYKNGWYQLLLLPANELAHQVVHASDSDGNFHI